jgi:hypothetical protein
MQDTPLYISLVYIMVYCMIYIYLYTMVYTIKSSLHSSSTASLSPAAPSVQRSSCRCFNVWTALRLASFSQSLSTPLLSFFHSDPARLPPPIVPHPEVGLIEPASVASPHAEICSSSNPVPKAVGQGGMLYWYVTHSGASASSLTRSPWPGSSSALYRLAFNRCISSTSWHVCLCIYAQWQIPVFLHKSCDLAPDIPV